LQVIGGVPAAGMTAALGDTLAWEREDDDSIRVQHVWRPVGGGALEASLQSGALATSATWSDGVPAATARPRPSEVFYTRKRPSVSAPPPRVSTLKPVMTLEELGIESPSSKRKATRAKRGDEQPMRRTPAEVHVQRLLQGNRRAWLPPIGKKGDGTGGGGRGSPLGLQKALAAGRSGVLEAMVMEERSQAASRRLKKQLDAATSPTAPPPPAESAAAMRAAATAAAAAAHADAVDRAQLLAAGADGAPRPPLDLHVLDPQRWTVAQHPRSVAGAEKRR
jgi:hypothetical protein